MYIMKLDKNEVLEHLSKNPKTMQLATLHESKPWICTVWFVYDEDLNIYWLSLPSRRHSQDIDLNPEVAAAVVIKPDDPTIGLQIQGRAEIVTNPELANQVMSKYVAKYGQGDKFYANLLAGTNKHQLYKLRLSEVTVFDEEKYKGDTKRLEL